MLYRDAALRRHQYFAHADWPGYPVVNPTVQGTKSAGLLAQAWAVLRYFTDEDYTALAARVADAETRLLTGLAALDGLRVLGTPAAGLVAVTATGPDGTPDLSTVLHLADEMRARGWYLQPQLAHGALPPNLHLTLTPATADRVDALLADLTTALATARTLPRPPPPRTWPPSPPPWTPTPSPTRKPPPSSPTRASAPTPAPPTAWPRSSPSWPPSPPASRNAF